MYACIHLRLINVFKNYNTCTSSIPSIRGTINKLATQREKLLTDVKFHLKSMFGSQIPKKIIESEVNVFVL